MDADVESRAPSGQPSSVIRTFLIADIRGYRRFSDAQGDEAAAQLAERFVSVARERVEMHAGSIVEVRGDEILAVFDSARQAIRAATDLQAAMAAEETATMPLGIGIDAGEAVPVGGGYRGRVLNMAARLCARARPGEILVTAELAHLSGAVQGIRFDDRGLVRLKGISRPVKLISVTRPPAPGEVAHARESIGGALEFRLLGPLEVAEDGRLLSLGGPRQRLVLAHLLLAANRVLPMEDLVDRVWDEEPPYAARNTIQSYVSHLRAVLGVDRIEGRAPGYVLHAEPEEVDMLRFEHLVRRARRELAIEPREAVAMLGEALALWRGSPLSDLAEAPSLAGEVARLQELRLGVVEEQLAARLALGEHTEALPDLERLTVQHPLRERLWAHLMLARYRSGRQADALASYRRAQELLAEELGIDPSQELQDLHRRILQQDPRLQITGHPLRGYRLLERVGEGAFGVVWRALDPELGREVAVKQIHPQLADDMRFVRRFEQEAQTIARLEHPHVVPLYDYWRDGNGAYLVMRWMRGGSLEELLGRGPMDPQDAIDVVDQVAAALSAAHRVHTVHRDVKPANVLLDEDGNAYLSDFGIAKDLTDSRDDGPSGSLGYQSPEQLQGMALTPRTDIYCLGMVVQDLLDGRQDLPPGVADVIARATADDPDSRFRDARDLVVALRDAFGLSVPTLPVRPTGEARNPYKGLLPFTEADADDFFGRDALVDRLVARLAEPVEGSRFLAVVGPSGSGKSSVVRAGLVPTLRQGALPGSDRWFYVEMLPGAHPMEELEAALLRIAVNPPRSLLDLLQRDEEGLSRIVSHLLPDDGTELVLVVDQLEEVFTLVEDENARDHFLRSLVAAVQEPGARLRVVATLRADFYDRPLSYPGLAELMRRRSETVVPLAPEELERAIDGPAERVGVVAELALVAEMVADVSDRSGTLPLLEYALTELFDRRRDGALSLEAYREIEGISGALARRAEQLFEGLSQPEREATKQVFLRLVTPGEGQADTRRLFPRAELLSLQLDRVAMEHVIDVFAGHRLIFLDRDPATRGPTVEVAHEALLRTWDRLRVWIDGAREDLRQHRRLATAAIDWETNGRDTSLLLRGSRLRQLQDWEGSTDLALSRDEQEYLAASVRQRELELADERARTVRERGLERRSLRRLRTLVAVLAAAALVAAGLTAVAVDRSRDAARHRDEATVAGLTGAVLSNLGTPELSLLLALHAVNASLSIGEPVPAETVEALHWALQAAGIEYPIEDGPTVMVAGPAGRRGLFALPVAQLVDLARAHTDRVLTPAECERFMGSPRCPPLPERFPSRIPSEPVRAVTGAPAGHPLAGTQVTLMEGSGEIGAARLRDAIAPFTDRTGIDVELIELPDFDQGLRDSIAAGDPPDLALFPQPGSVATLARDGHLMDLATYLDVERLNQNQSPYLVSLGTVGPDGSWPSAAGGTYGVVTSVALKGLIWYPVPEFRAAGYDVPETWDGLIALSDRLVADRRTPWCMGFGSGRASGWPGTDWIESLLLAGAGPEVYDRWTFHRIPFDSPPVRTAFERFGQIAFTKGYMYRGADGALVTDLSEAQLPMVERDPPGCWLYHFPDFAANFLIGGSVGRDTDVFPFPTIAGRSRGLIGGGDMLSAFTDRPEVREVVKYFLSPEFGADFARVGNTLIPNRHFDLTKYPPFWRREARLLTEALAADTFRFDASDLMPPRVGQEPFFEAMMTYLHEGPDSLDGILADLDAAWPDDG